MSSTNPFHSYALNRLLHPYKPPLPNTINSFTPHYYCFHCPHFINSYVATPPKHTFLYFHPAPFPHHTDLVLLPSLRDQSFLYHKHASKSPFSQPALKTYICIIAQTSGIAALDQITYLNILTQSPTWKVCMKRAKECKCLMCERKENWICLSCVKQIWKLIKNLWNRVYGMGTIGYE